MGGEALPPSEEDKKSRARPSRPSQQDKIYRVQIESLGWIASGGTATRRRATDIRGVSDRSILALQTELLRCQESQRSGTTETRGTKVTCPLGPLNPGVTSRAQRDKDLGRGSSLDEKALLYERLSQGILSGIPDAEMSTAAELEEIGERYGIDFLRKDMERDRQSEEQPRHWSDVSAAGGGCGDSGGGGGGRNDGTVWGGFDREGKGVISRKRKDSPNDDAEKTGKRPSVVVSSKMQRLKEDFIAKKLAKLKEKTKTSTP